MILALAGAAVLSALVGYFGGRARRRYTLAKAYEAGHGIGYGEGFRAAESAMEEPWPSLDSEAP